MMHSRPFAFFRGHGSMGEHIDVLLRRGRKRVRVRGPSAPENPEYNYNKLIIIYLYINLFFGRGRGAEGMRQHTLHPPALKRT